MRDTRELAWAAGLFEGEGWFTLSRKTPHAGIAMADKDSVQRFADAIGLGKIKQRAKRKTGFGPFDEQKPIWDCRVQGREQTQAVVAMLWFGLGARRRARAAEVLAVSHSAAIRESDRTHCPHGHPYDDANTIVRGDGHRTCRACNKRWSSRRYRQRVSEGYRLRTTDQGRRWVKVQ